MSNWKYDPKDATRCLPEGEYEALVKDCEYGTSKSSGNDMATLKVEVYHGERRVTVKDWMVNVPNMVWKLKHLARAVGAEAQFDSGMFEPHHAVGEAVRVTLTIDDSGSYGDQNRIGDYKSSELAASGAPHPNFDATKGGTEIPADDEIPF